MFHRINKLFVQIYHCKICLRNSSYSSLYVSARYGQEMFRVIVPSFDSEYLNSISENIYHVKELFNKRGIANNYDFDDLKTSIKLFDYYSKDIQHLKKKRKRLSEKFKKNNSSQELKLKINQIQEHISNSRNHLYNLEDKVVPFLLNVPNDIAPGIEDKPKILDQWREPSKNFNSYHNFVKLGYLNNLFQRSIVGPNAIYLHCEGAKLYYGLLNLICDQLEQEGFSSISGLDIVKSAIVEAVNSKPFADDPYILKLSSGQSDDNQRLHLVGDASLESLCALITKIKLDHGKHYQVGSSYEIDRFEQKHIVRATILCQAEESSSMMEYLYKISWNIMKEMGVERCSIRSDVTSLYPNEYDKYFLLVWLKSRSEWMHVGILSHYHHYISQRLGLAQYRNYHLISLSVDLITLINTMVEQFQIFETGKINFPPNITKYIT